LTEIIFNISYKKNVIYDHIKVVKKLSGECLKRLDQQRSALRKLSSSLQIPSGSKKRDDYQVTA
jgi:hypothetical protein